MARRVKIFGEHEPDTLLQFDDVASRADFAALMADGHLGYTMPVGGVAAYRNHVSIAGVGVDIACGNAAVCTDLRLEDFEPRDLAEIADTIYAGLVFGAGGTNADPAAPWDHPLFDDPRWGRIPAAADPERLRDKARAQLGTIGGGNHYVDVLADEQGRLWVGCHFGSRGLGYEVSNGFAAFTAGHEWKAGKPRDHEGLVHWENPLGADYVALMQLAGDYAHAGRDWVVRRVAEWMGAVAELDYVHNHHNFAWREEHDGEWLWVVRKGATPAFPGQRGFVGGSMGDDAVILRGAVHEEGSGPHWLQRQALFSTVHGAGRVMSRGDARRTLDRGDVDALLRDRGVHVRGAGLDEAPGAYRRLADVLEHQGPTVEVEHVLRPVVVCMAADSRGGDPLTTE